MVGRDYDEVDCGFGQLDLVFSFVRVCETHIVQLLRMQRGSSVPAHLERKRERGRGKSVMREVFFKKCDESLMTSEKCKCKCTTIAPLVITSKGKRSSQKRETMCARLTWLCARLAWLCGKLCRIGFY